ncbi:MAG: gluconate 2-dehydrogenase subunit 3 family protein [Bacteroidota bacterium]|nr:gluconate 2-dehydrogenase subunit 3 family protein [Bacteroidota bacterium]
MDRRSTLKTLFIISAGAALLPSCLQQDKKSSLSFKNIKIDDKDENLVNELAETIIPKTDTPGAKDVKASAFALMMLDDCYAPADQDKFVKGMKEFDEFSKKRFNKSFVDCLTAQRLDVVKIIEDKKDVPENVIYFFNTTKRLTLQAYTSSEYYLTKVHVYQLVPGKFYGCVPVKKAS